MQSLVTDTHAATLGKNSTTDKSKSIKASLIVRDIGTSLLGEGEQARIRKLVLWTLASFANADGTKAFPGFERIAACACCSRSSVIRAIKWLVNHGFLLVESKGGYTGPLGRTNLYTVILDDSKWLRYEDGVPIETLCSDGEDSVPQREDSVPTETPNRHIDRPKTQNTYIVSTEEIPINKQVNNGVFTKVNTSGSSEDFLSPTTHQNTVGSEATPTPSSAFPPPPERYIDRDFVRVIFTSDMPELAAYTQAARVYFRHRDFGLGEVVGREESPFDDTVRVLVQFPGKPEPLAFSEEWCLAQTTRTE